MRVIDLMNILSTRSGEDRITFTDNQGEINIQFDDPSGATESMEFNADVLHKMKDNH